MVITFIFILKQLFNIPLLLFLWLHGRSLLVSLVLQLFYSHYLCWPHGVEEVSAPHSSSTLG